MKPFVAELERSPLLKETIRYQMSRLQKMPEPQFLQARFHAFEECAHFGPSMTHYGLLHGGEDLRVYLRGSREEEPTEFVNGAHRRDIHWIHGNRRRDFRPQEDPLRTRRGQG